MNNLHVLSRTQHPNLFVQNAMEQKQNRVKIQLTQTQGFPFQLQKSNISTSQPMNYSKGNQNNEAYVIKEISFPAQQPKHNIDVNINLYKLMKEQLDIAASGYRQKTNKVLKEQAQKIQKLSAIISHGNKVIQKQSEIIANMRNNKDYLINSTYTRVMGTQNRSISKSPKKISLTHKNAGRNMLNVRDVSPLKGQLREKEEFQSKINRLQQIIEQIQKKSRDSTNQSRELLKKVSNIERTLHNQIWNRIKVGQQALRRFMLGNEKRLINVDKTVEVCLNFKNQVVKKVMFLQEQQKQIKQLIFNLQEREYVYDSYQLNVLKEQLNYMNQVVSTLIVSNNPEAIARRQVVVLKQKPVLKQGDPMNYSQHVSVKRKNNFDTQFVELERSQYSSLSHYAPKYVKGVEEDRVRRSEEWDLQQNNSGLSDEDEFYYDNNILTEEEMTSDRAHKLEEVMRKKGYRFPVEIEVDQTGYMKVQRTGMYILDQNDNGFQLRGDELQTLRRKGIIHFD